MDSKSKTILHSGIIRRTKVRAMPILVYECISAGRVAGPPGSEGPAGGGRGDGGSLPQVPLVVVCWGIAAVICPYLGPWC